MALAVSLGSNYLVHGAPTTMVENCCVKSPDTNTTV